MAPFPELLKVMRLALMPPAKVKHRKPHQATKGIPLLLDDVNDKITRLYTHCVETKVGLEPSFVFAAAEAYRHGFNQMGELCGNKDSDARERFFIRWRYWTPIPAGLVLEVSGDKKHGGREEVLHELCGKLVIVGGTYLDMDQHFTPLGVTQGVFVLANAIHTELGSPSPEISKRAVLLLELCAGTALIVILEFGHFSLWMKGLFGLLIVFALCFVFTAATWVAFRSTGSQQYIHIAIANFLPILLAVLIFEILDHIRHESILSFRSHAK